MVFNDIRGIVMKKTKVTESINFFSDDSILKDLSNSSIVFTEVGPVIIDTFGTTKQWKTVEDFLNKKGYSEPYAVIFTHGHFDHTLGNQASNLNYPIYAHARTSEVMDNAKEVMLPRLIRDGYLSEDTKIIYPTITFKEEMCIKAGSYRFKLIHTPGHSDDSITIYEEKSKVAFVGDNLIEIDGRIAIPSFDFSKGIDDKNNTFLHTLNTVKNLESKVLIQGHGYSINPKKYFDIIDTYKQSVLSYAENSVANNISSDTIENTSPEDVLDKRLIDNIFDLKGKFCTFSDNLLSAFNYFRKNS